MRLKVQVKSPLSALCQTSDNLPQANPPQTTQIAPQKFQLINRGGIFKFLLVSIFFVPDFIFPFMFRRLANLVTMSSRKSPSFFNVCPRSSFDERSKAQNTFPQQNLKCILGKNSKTDTNSQDFSMLFIILLEFIGNQY